MRKFDIPDEYAAHTCFGEAYIFTLLGDGFHIGLDEKRLVFSNTARGPSGERFEAKWVLGALLGGYWGACKAPGQQLWTGWENQKEAAGLSIQC